MNSPATFFFVSVAVLAAVTAIFFFANKKSPEKRLSGLATVSFIFILTGIIFGDNIIVGYALLLAGSAVAAVDFIKKRSDAKKEQ